MMFSKQYDIFLTDSESKYHCSDSAFVIRSEFKVSHDLVRQSMYALTIRSTRFQVVELDSGLLRDNQGCLNTRSVCTTMQSGEIKESGAKNAGMWFFVT
jgi:hypothetical protein